MLLLVNPANNCTDIGKLRLAEFALELTGNGAVHAREDGDKEEDGDEGDGEDTNEEPDDDDDADDENEGDEEENDSDAE